MLQLSPQNITNLVNYPGRISTNSSSNYAAWSQHLIFVSDQVAFPEDSSTAYQYINNALNCSAYGNAGIATSGDVGNIANCLGIASFQSRSGIVINNNIFAMNGPFEFVAKQSGRVGGVIFTQLYGTTSAAVQSNYPIANASTLTQYNSLSGDVYNNNVPCIWNYVAITNSIGVGDALVSVDTIDLVQGQTHTLYGASFKFSGA